jgi:beta-glucosidase
MTKDLNGLPWRRLWKVGKPFWVSEKRNIALLHLLGVLTLLGANTALMVFINHTAGAFMTAIEQRSVPQFYHYLMIYAGALIVVTPIQVFYGYLRTRLALIWRSWLANKLFAGYFTNLAYYKLINNGEIDNPDQRMTQDVDSFCNSSVGLFISILDAVVNVVIFAGVLWAISPTLTFTVLAYAAAGSLIVVLIGRRLVGLNFQQMKTEADLRFGLAEARREAEAIAFYRGEDIAREQARGKLRLVIDTLMQIMTVNRNIQFFTNVYNMLVPLIPAAIIAPLYLANKAPFGDITQATMAFTVVFNGATFMISQFGGISSYSAIINRLGSFLEAVEACGADNVPAENRIEMVEGPYVAFEKCTIKTPDLARTLIRDLDLVVRSGESLYINGPDGAGKTALLRNLRGLWNSGSGKLMRPAPADMMFLSQNPYLPPTNLREAISYPCLDACMDDARMMQILSLVGLSDLVERCGVDKVQNWRDILSLSEQQRLSIARVIFSKPKFAIVDEATSALEADNEKLLYGLLTSLGSTIISAGNGADLAKYHTQVLELDGKGGWKLFPAKDIPKFLVRRAVQGIQSVHTASLLDSTSLTLPKGFVWGTGTSAYQVEGAWNEGGKGESIWDRFSHSPGKIKGGDTGDIACDQYRLFAQDIALAKSLNLNAYRFSISWPRVQPTGRGNFNQEGIDFYNRVIDAIVEAGMEPFVTLYHWDLPQALQDDFGGFASRDVVRYFAEYSAKMVQCFGDRVKFWTTFNEPWCVSFLGHESGYFAPGLKDPALAAQVAHNLLVSHGLACRAMRAVATRPIEIGIVLNLTITEPLNPEDTTLAEDAWKRDCGFYLEPLFRGVYPDFVKEKIGDLQDGDLAIISEKLDYLGINFYSRNLVSKSQPIHPVPGSDYTAMGWEVHPQSLRLLLNRIWDEYGPVLYVTENGAAYDDVVNADGTVHDDKRLAYLKGHIQQAALALEDGVDLRGYFAWSLLDNFEWAEGYSRRFGIVYVDYTNQARIVKDSGFWYGKLAGSNTIERPQ